MKIKVIIDYDPDPEDPCNWDGWKVIPFSTRLRGSQNAANYVASVDAFGDPVPANIGLHRKLAAGTAFWLSYFEHSGCVWSLKGCGPQCQFDTTRLAGILLWDRKASELSKTYDERRACAVGFLETYTAWCNGDCYWFCFEVADCRTCDKCGQTVCEADTDVYESCGGFIGEAHLAEDIRDTIKRLLHEHPTAEFVRGDTETCGHLDQVWLDEQVAAVKRGALICA